MTGPMTIPEVLQAAEVLRAAAGGLRVVYSDEEGRLVNGTARSVGDTDGRFARDDEDVRGLYLRVTTVEGWERFEPVSELMAKVASGEFAAHQVDNG